MGLPAPIRLKESGTYHPGPRLQAHPTKRGAKVLHIRRADDKGPDCASWNFAARAAGYVDLRLFPRRGFAGLDIALNDRFFNPGDERGETEAVFRLHIPADGRLTEEATLPLDEWSTLTLEWDLSRHRCIVRVDGQAVLALPQQADGFGGVSYLRLRSAADDGDSSGCLIESVRVGGGEVASSRVEPSGAVDPSRKEGDVAGEPRWFRPALQQRPVDPRLRLIEERGVEGCIYPRPEYPLLPRNVRVVRNVFQDGIRHDCPFDFLPPDPTGELRTTLHASDNRTQILGKMK